MDEMMTFKPVETLNWLFLDLNSFFASVEQQEDPALRGRPVAVVPMETDSTCAIAASYEAKAYGIKTGTKIFEAKKMCPDLVCVLARHDQYVRYHKRIFAEVENHIHVSKICSIDEAACALMGTERRLENALQIAAKIKDGLRQQVGEHVRCSIGIAPNKFLAKIATDMQKPDGLTVLEPGNYENLIYKLSLSDLTGIGMNMRRRLERNGIYTVKQLWDLNPKHARAVWGSVEGERFWYKLRGYDIPDKETNKRVIGHSRVLDPEHRPPEKAFEIAGTLTVKAASRLRRYELYARKFVLQVRCVDGGRWAMETSFSPTQDNFTFTKALQRLWQKMLWDLKPTKLKKIALTIHDLHKPSEVTLDLFEMGGADAEKSKVRKEPDRYVRLSEAMDKIGQKYGKGALSLGVCPKTKAGYVGTKIAFTRVPEPEEFNE